MLDDSVIFLDFEAASLQGWPVEIGLSWLAEGKVRTWASLIRPRPDWSDDLWDPAAEKIHGICRAMLDEAPSADQIAAEVLSRISDRILVSDAPEFDARWLEWLTGERIEVELFGVFAFKTVSSRGLPPLFDRLARLKVPHRAGPDSARLAKAWHHGLRASGTGLD
ncbi:3'-5' exonuclease [Defluviimonas salinarum]|uniref:Exonuclease domain-containing protein n=1 Tax=Defluviimonas salinarum TaxID=2992147 RepID=A0ABT3J1J6_9RHOB|nr:hypothetical protein [Defluviimonas salinarum]MCW3781562.1 hypothetical protein [Defluviimonas salinarum]